MPPPRFPTLEQFMPQIDLEEIMEFLRGTNERRTWPLWQEDDCLAFIARGREYRSEFHLNPSYEMQYSLKGDLFLHWRTPENKVNISIFLKIVIDRVLIQKKHPTHQPGQLFQFCGYKIKFLNQVKATNYPPLLAGGVGEEYDFS